MVGCKRLFCALLLTILYGQIGAQNDNPIPSVNSPYSRYGFGKLADQSFGKSNAMGGVSYGVRDGSQINAANPASYTAIDSLTFIFEGALSLQNANFDDGTQKINAKNSSFDYVAMQFRLNKRLALSAGFIPFSNVGYNFVTYDKITEKENANSASFGYARKNYYGDGGLQQIYLGAGFKILEGLSIGANVSYLFGSVSHTSNLTFPNDQSAFQYTRINKVRVTDYKVDLGLQYTQKFGTKNAVTLGLVFSPKHALNSDASTYTLASTDTIVYNSVKSDLPNMFGGGFTYVYDNRITVGFDYSYQQWSEARFIDEFNYGNRSRYAIGAEYLPSFTRRNYLTRIRYRIGAYYSDPYIKIQGENAGREYGVTAGFGLPVFDSKSMLNVSAQYIKVSSSKKSMIDETYLKLTVGLTFNERWFMKWKVK